MIAIGSVIHRRPRLVIGRQPPFVGDPHFAGQVEQSRPRQDPRAVPVRLMASNSIWPDPVKVCGICSRKKTRTVWPAKAETSTECVCQLVLPFPSGIPVEKEYTV